MIRKVAVIMGSDSDWPVVKGACAQLKALDIPFEAHILSAHRTPAEAAEFAKNARANGFGVILCAAGMAAHLAGAFAANTTLPVIGIPVKSSTLDGLDALLSTVQMPPGMPVATVAIDGAVNAALLAAQILAVTDDEIAAVVAHLKSQGEPEYHSEILKTNVVTLGDSSPSGEGGSEADDPLLWEAADVVVSSDLGSTSNLQRRLKVGYARAGRIMDQLEEKGIVGPANGSRPREVLVDQMELETLKAL